MRDGAPAHLGPPMDGISRETILLHDQEVVLEVGSTPGLLVKRLLA